MPAGKPHYYDIATFCLCRNNFLKGIPSMPCIPMITHMRDTPLSSYPPQCQQQRYIKHAEEAAENEQSQLISAATGLRSSPGLYFSILPSIFTYRKTLMRGVMSTSQ